MKGDIYLSVEFDNNNGENLINNIFENWLSVYPEKITANLAAASRHSDTKSASNAIKSLIKSWINDVDDISNSQKSKRLELAVPISYLAPDEIINLIYTYINKSSDEGIYSLTRDNYGPIIYQILHIPGLEKNILALILLIAHKELKGTYNNYEPSNLIKQITSPIEVNIDLATNALSEILEWVKKNDCSEVEAKLAVEAVRESLSGSHEHRESYSNKITFGRRILVYKKPFQEKVDKYRDKGMEILKKIIFHNNPNVQKIGIEIINDIGHEALSDDSNFLKRILSDKKQAISWLKKLIHDKTQFTSLSAIEDVLIRYWANNDIYPELSTEIAEILRKYPRSPEYIIFRYFVAHDVIISDFTQIEKDAPETNRWSWLVHNHFRRHDLKQEDLDQIIELLASKMKNKNDFIKYLNKLGQETADVRTWQYIPLIETWAKFNKDIIIEIAKEEKLLRNVPNIFHRGFYRVASDEDKDYIKICADKIIKNIDNLDIGEVDNLLDLISRSNISVEEFMPWLIKITENSNSHTKHIILHRAYFIFKDKQPDERKKVLDLLNVSLVKNVDTHVLDMFEFLLHNALQWNLPSAELEKLRIKLFDITKDINNIDYQIDELLNFVIDGDLDKFINFIDYRLNKFQNKKNIGQFDPIPHNGFRFSESLIKNYEDFSKLMDKIHFWRSSDMLFSFDIDNLLRNFKQSSDEDSVSYLVKYIQEKIQTAKKDKVKIAISSLYGIKFGGDTSDLFLNMLLVSEKVGLLNEAREVFFHQVLSGGYSSSIGEAPPALVNKKNALEAIHKKCPPGLVKNYIDSLTRSIADDIQRHMDEGQELINPKN
ncbi:MAG: hypothetical protein GF329_05700 [Candidatus Lokiarchaeota archaeon]|nr:hypothetical protein [Candidatus Lokiarchaeota archaeon]